MAHARKVRNHTTDVVFYTTPHDRLTIEKRYTKIDLLQKKETSGTAQTVLNDATYSIVTFTV